MSGNRRNNKMDMSIIEQLESIKAKCCGICKYLDAFEKNTMDCPDGMCQEEYLKNKGERMPLRDVARITGIKPITIYYRLKHGMSDEDAIKEIVRE